MMGHGWIKAVLLVTFLQFSPVHFVLCQDSTSTEETTEVLPEYTSNGIAPDDSVVPFDIWMCGNNETIKNETYKMAISMFNIYMEPINECCVVHDWCYERQLGRNECDIKLCMCLVNTLKDSAAYTFGYSLSQCQIKLESQSHDAYEIAGALAVKENRIIDKYRNEPDLCSDSVEGVAEAVYNERVLPLKKKITDKFSYYCGETCLQIVYTYFAIHASILILIIVVVVVWYCCVSRKARREEEDESDYSEDSSSTASVRSHRSERRYDSEEC